MRASNRPVVAAAPPVPQGPKKLSFKEKRELEALPGRIEALEARLAELHVQMADPAYHRQGADKIAANKQELGQVERDLEAAYARWGELDA